MAEGIQCYLEIWRVRKSDQTIYRIKGWRLLRSNIPRGHGACDADK